ncbi:MAG: hypothetical protein SWX82_22400 [Cyanobacteriota bacterium]|nr:hypothetical protein [Cyanobacteriota bacterium]
MPFAPTDGGLTVNLRNSCRFQILLREDIWNGLIVDNKGYFTQEILFDNFIIHGFS